MLFFAANIAIWENDVPNNFACFRLLSPAFASTSQTHCCPNQRPEVFVNAGWTIGLAINRHSYSIESSDAGKNELSAQRENGHLNTGCVVDAQTHVTQKFYSRYNCNFVFLVRASVPNW